MPNRATLHFKRMARVRRFDRADRQAIPIRHCDRSAVWVQDWDSRFTRRFAHLGVRSPVYNYSPAAAPEEKRLALE